MSLTPQRIVCLSAETADWLWRLGAWGQVAGITAFFELPPEIPARPRVSGFDCVRFDQLEALKPDLILAFSDVQAGLAAELVRHGFNVVATNQRTLAETEATLWLLARIVGREREATPLLQQFRTRLAPVPVNSRRPRVYFEEWNDPLISGIAWVSELIERAGGTDVFAEFRTRRAASDRVVSPAQVRAANPEIILASWCGKPMDAATIATRPGWNTVAAVHTNRIHEIPGADILQPGFGLTRGYEQLKRHIELWQSQSENVSYATENQERPK
jgi:iron complex transport system substrate-binding protein